MRKIRVTGQFFETNGLQGHFLKKTKDSFSDVVLESVCIKFLVCILSRLVRLMTQSLHKPTNQHLNEQMLLLYHDCQFWLESIFKFFRNLMRLYFSDDMLECPDIGTIIL